MADQVPTQNQSPLLTSSKKRKRNTTTVSGPRKPREKPIQCPVCLTGRSPKLILDALACNCIYCVPCIRELFLISLRSEDGISNYPAQCCEKVLDFMLLEGSLTPQLRKAYKSKAEEMASNDPLYCGNSECGAFILEGAIKDNFGSCGKCKMKTCVRKECNKTKAEHFGVHGICPGELDTEELRTLAEEKGWKRCPKCYALTERSKGCDDIRCVCRTEWCYKCGKALRSTKDVCTCYPPRVPPPVAPSVQSSQNDLRTQSDTIMIDDEDDQDADTVDVKPLIEEIERNSGSIFYMESDLLALHDYYADLPAQSSSSDQTAQPRASPPQAEQDFIEELDALVAPNAREILTSLQRTSSIDATSVERTTPAVAQESTVEDYPESLEDMLLAFNTYEASSSSSAVDVPIMDPDNTETNFDHRLPQLARHGSIDPTPNSSIESIFTSMRQDEATTNPMSKPPHYAHTPTPETNPDTTTLIAHNHKATCTSVPEAISSTAKNESVSHLLDPESLPSLESEPKPDSEQDSLSLDLDEILDSERETTQVMSDTASDLDADWLMGSIEDYLMT